MFIFWFGIFFTWKYIRCETITTLPTTTTRTMQTAAAPPPPRETAKKITENVKINGIYCFPARVVKS